MIDVKWQFYTEKASQNRKTWISPKRKLQGAPIMAAQSEQFWKSFLTSPWSTYFALERNKSIVHENYVF
jgi:myosin-crossreactive antigen